MNKFFVIPDLHGMYDNLILALKEYKNNYSDRQLIFLGDYIDRGPNSAKILEFLSLLKKAIYLLGNHEEMLLNGLNGNQEMLDLWCYNGGYNTINSYQQDFNKYIVNNILPKHKKFLESLKLKFETDEYFFSHAGINPFHSWDKQTKEDLIWERYVFKCLENKFPKLVICGHTPDDEVRMFDDRICLDTGCFYTKKLSCMILPERKILEFKI